MKNRCWPILRPTQYAHKISWESVKPFWRSSVTDAVTREFYTLDLCTAGGAALLFSYLFRAKHLVQLNLPTDTKTDPGIVVHLMGLRTKFNPRPNTKINRKPHHNQSHFTRRYRNITQSSYSSVPQMWAKPIVWRWPTDRRQNSILTQIANSLYGTSDIVVRWSMFYLCCPCKMGNKFEDYWSFEKYFFLPQNTEQCCSVSYIGNGPDLRIARRGFEPRQAHYIMIFNFITTALKMVKENIVRKRHVLEPKNRRYLTGLLV